MVATAISNLTVPLSQSSVGAQRYLKKEGIHVEGPLATANQQIRDAERQAVRQRRTRLAEPQRLTDRLLHQLEELNLDGVTTVPDRYEPVLADLRGQLAHRPGLSRRLVERLQPGTRPAELIETIFSIQEVIAPPTLEPGEFPFDEVI